jgi:hypothetical protein
MKEYPLEFLNIFGVYSIVRLALFIEEIGIVQFTHLLVSFVEYLWDSKLNSSNNTTNVIHLRGEKDHQKLDQNEAKDEITIDFLINSDSANTPTTENENIENINLLISSDTFKTHSSGFSNFIEKSKYVFSTILSISCFGFVIFCVIKGYSSSNKTILAQFSVLICALFVFFYCEGESSSLLTSYLTLLLMISVFLFSYLHP